MTILTEVRPGWTRSFLDQENTIVYHITKTDHKNSNDEHLFSVMTEDSSIVEFLGCFTAVEINNNFKILL